MSLRSFLNHFLQCYQERMQFYFPMQMSTLFFNAIFQCFFNTDYYIEKQKSLSYCFKKDIKLFKKGFKEYKKSTFTMTSTKV